MNNSAVTTFLTSALITAALNINRPKPIILNKYKGSGKPRPKNKAARKARRINRNKK
jgi:hypothetical protein